MSLALGSRRCLNRGTYVEVLQTGKVAFSERDAAHEMPWGDIHRPVGAKLDVEAGRKAAHLAAAQGPRFCQAASGRSTKWRGSSGSACRWPRREMSAINRNSPTPLRSYCKAFSKKTKVLGA
jgi:hypothetical protein